MSQVILLNESTASNRIVYIWSVLSNGTSPAQFEAAGQPTMSVAGLTKWNSAGTLLAIDSTNGEYAVRLGTSDVSVSGPGVIRYSSASALETSIPFQIVAYNAYDATKLGLTSVSTFDASVLSVTALGAPLADSLLGRNVAGGSSAGRTVSQALYALRNKVTIDGSAGTVFQTDDATSSWTFSIATASVNSGLIRTVDPQ